MKNYAVIFYRHPKSTQSISAFVKRLRSNYRVISEEFDAGVYFIEAPDSTSAEDITDMLRPYDLDSLDVLLVLRMSTSDHAGGGGCGTGTLRILRSLK
jgi:hypothetical protein